MAGFERMKPDWTACTKHAKSIGEMLDIAVIPHYFSKTPAVLVAGHKACLADGAAISRACDHKAHGDQASREVLKHIDALAAGRWIVRLNDGSATGIGILTEWAE